MSPLRFMGVALTCLYATVAFANPDNLTLSSDSRTEIGPERKASAPHAVAKRAIEPQAQPKPHIVKKFTNTDCLKTDSCDLKSFELEVSKTFLDQDQHDSSFDDLYQGDLMIAGYETKDLASLEKFGVVQFIKGCHLGRTMTNGKPLYYIDSVRSFFDFKQLFLHPSWLVDSIDTDPLYSSVPYDPSRYSSIPRNQWKRHAAYRINKPNPFIDETPEQQEVYQFKNPTQPKLYIYDYPTGSYGSSSRKFGEYTYASMVFKTCIFKTTDIPTEVRQEWDGGGKELACFEWSNNYRYDTVRDLFVAATQLDPLCEDKAWADQVYTSYLTPIGEPELDWSKKSQDLGLNKNSCQAIYGTRLANGTHFAGDLCVDYFHQGKDTSSFLTPIGPEPRFAPNPFLTGYLADGGGTSVRLSTLQTKGVNDLKEIFSAMKADALSAAQKGNRGTDADRAILERIGALNLYFLEAGPGCEGGQELAASHDPVLNGLLLCPGWTNLARETMIEMLAVQVAGVFDPCRIKPIYKMSNPLIADLKKSQPRLIETCFKKDPELNSPQTIANVTAYLQDVVNSGRTEFETLHLKIDPALVKCSLAQPSARTLPKQYDQFVGSETWTCARRSSGDTSPTKPVVQPWLNEKICSPRVREIHQNTLAADLMSRYLTQRLSTPLKNPSLLLYGRVGRACGQQGLSDPEQLGSFERLALYLGRSEIQSAIGCTADYQRALCESRLF